MKIQNAELLAPAGSYDCLKAAINAGCDAVYLGGSLFGARAFADNLNTEDMKMAIDFVHLHDKKIYLTVNTLLKNNEIKDKLYNYLEPFYLQGLDAVIVQDLGVFEFIRKNFPEMHIHASTQMTVTGVAGARKLKELGAARVVTARELSLYELSEINKNVDVEIESFVHGALCYGYSGQCLLSSMLGGRSGNRGRCAQPCRLPYDVRLSDGTVNKNTEKYILSPKDLCTINILPQILEAGVYSLKVEGRMKSPEYVAGVMEIYRKYIDLYFEKGANAYSVSENDYQKLTDLYSRSGFTDGYYKRHNERNMISLIKPAYSSADSGRAAELNEKYVKTDKKIPIYVTATIKKDKPMELMLKTNQSDITVSGSVPELSTNQPATIDKVEKQLKKFGSTPFIPQTISVELDDGLFLPVKELNDLRRKAVEALTAELLSCHYRKCAVQAKIETNNNIESKKRFICSVETNEQLEAVINNKNVTDIYLSSDYFELDDTFKDIVSNIHDAGKRVFLTMPFIFRKEAVSYFDSHISYIKNSGLDGIIVKTIDELAYGEASIGLPMIADYSLYTMNDYAKSFLMNENVKSTTVPLELNNHEIAGRSNKGDEIVVYGYMPLMITAGCVKKTLNKCQHKSDKYTLQDRYQKIFTAKTVCRYCYNVLYNCQPLSLLKFSHSIEKMEINAIRLNFTIENAKETAAVINKFENSFVYDNETEDINNYTRGHFKRGVE